MFFPPISVSVSGERFSVTYHVLAADEQEAHERALGISLEQSVELPLSLVPPGDMRDHVIGLVDSLRPLGPGRYEAVITYAVEITGFEYLQFLNVLFGNTSMQTGIRVMRFDLPPSLLAAFKGARFGTAGLRRLLGAPARPLLGTAIKPVGFPPQELADAAYRFALGGLDVIKEDHGLIDQPFASFRERVARCAEAVRKANAETGGRSLYAPNVTGPIDQVLERAHYAKQVGATALEIMPGLAGFDAVRALAADDELGLPILSHPAMLGTFTISPDQGIALQVIMGQMPRLAGADATIYTTFGGRFPTRREDVSRLLEAIREPLGSLKPILPMPGGGMTVEAVPDILAFYGRDVILLISGGLYSIGPDLVDNCRRFREAVEQAAALL
ncbi:MAG: 5-methylthioribulose-1-phosphate isomerase [Anaerolineae bacterium]